jgi:hypothetical protein
VDPAAVIDKHLPDLEQARRPTADRLIDLIQTELPDSEHDLKWGRLTFTRNGDWHHWICAVAPTKKVVRLVLHKGVLLDDRHATMEGTGRYTRSISFGAPDEINPDVVVPILRQAAERQTEMLPGESP